jgi:hypothetical protein
MDETQEKKIIENIKVKLSLYIINSAQCHENVWRSGGIMPCILNIRTRWR